MRHDAAMRCCLPPRSWEPGRLATGCLLDPAAITAASPAALILHLQACLAQLESAPRWDPAQASHSSRSSSRHQAVLVKHHAPDSRRAHLAGITGKHSGKLARAVLA
jgi:hypothetical protein